MINIPRTEIEALVASKAIEKYRNIIKNIKYQEDFLKNKKINFGDLVKVSIPIFCNGIGKVIGWDFEYNYYRIYFDEDNSYIGVCEDKIIAFDGEAPSDLINYDPYDLKFMYENKEPKNEFFQMGNLDTEMESE